MASRRDWAAILRVIYWGVAVLVLMYSLLPEEPGPFKMRLYFRTSRVCYGVASLAGELGLEAERAYWDVVRELN